jgi:hypothetical protein
VLSGYHVMRLPLIARSAKTRFYRGDAGGGVIRERQSEPLERRHTDQIHAQSLLVRNDNVSDALKSIANNHFIGETILTVILISPMDRPFTGQLVKKSLSYDQIR